MSGAQNQNTTIYIYTAYIYINGAHQNSVICAHIGA
uniref:Uncharacterized protein n=1 Tax=Anguilla anguilla TaxID=7936 RepID=A0A0E9S2L8_ANGAN